MQPPTTAQICTAIEVLKKLGEHINNCAAHIIMQLPKTKFGDNHTARIEARTNEETTQIESLTANLNRRYNELQQKRRQNVSQHV